MIELIGVPVGAKLKLHGGIVGEILECIDGEWVKSGCLSPTAQTPKSATKNSAMPPM